MFREPTTVEVLLAGAPIYADLSKLQCCPPTCGAAAAVVVSADYARRKGLMARSVVIAGQALTTDAEPSFADGSMIAGVGADMTRRAARQAKAEAVKSLREIVAQERATLQAKDEVAFSPPPDRTQRQSPADPAAEHADAHLRASHLHRGPGRQRAAL